ncbi:MAG TPA: aminodeoxychorismate synthase component I [Longimicrobiales bacterium]|nr:aminodeoxychorismate synthase component I [Longimicrobiales bacterium]
MSHALFDFPGASRLRFSRPRQIIEARSLDEVRPALDEVAAAAARGAWAAGFVAYEAAPAFDAALVTREPTGPAPLAWFAICDGPDTDEAAAPGTGARLHWRTPTPRSAYDAAIREIRERIAAGDVYQVNHTLRFCAGPPAATPGALYTDLVAARHGRYHALLEDDGWAVVSASPELFFQLEGRQLTTRPMKGTSRRGRWLAEDRAAAACLRESPKDRAENLMIVDLLRNDLGRIARFGSVQVPRLFDVETYPSVHQLTSTVTGELRPDVTLGDIFAAMFPCGSVTGAPKVTAMRAIAELEDTPRGPYCGAVGLVRPGGDATFNVAIRTVTMDTRRGTATYGTGGGITWDSRADAEYDEAVAKAGLLTETLPPFRLLETMRMDSGVIVRLDRHLQRLRDSAAYWQFPEATAAAAATALAATAERCPTGSMRVRLTAGSDGDIQVETSPLNGASDTPPTFAIARRAVSAADRLLAHKTTARAVYDERRADFPDAFDVLLFNDEGMATEFTFGNLVVSLDGRLLTPPRSDGLLAGTCRQELLDEAVIAEAHIRLADVRRADAVFHVNSVRGVTRVVPMSVSGS